MITFLTLLLGLSAGPHPFEVQVDAAAAFVEFQLDGRTFGSVTKPPWKLIVDLGVWWQEKTGLPLPLGGNVVRRDLGAETMHNISRLIKESIRYSLDHRPDRFAANG